MRLLLSEQAGFLFVNKPPGVLSVVGRGAGSDERVIAELVRAELALPASPLVCHRLDRDTSGVMLLARDAAAHRAANEQFEKHRVRKSYLALCHGRFEGVRQVDRPLGPDPHAPRGQRSRQRSDETGRPARTVLVGMWSDGEVSLVAARPSTGRTHQVRAHLAAEGHVLLGDTMYGAAPGPRAMLHAAWLWLFALGAEREAGAPIWSDMAALVASRGGPQLEPRDVDLALTRAVRGT